MRTSRKHQSGQTIVFVGFVLSILIAIAALVITLGEGQLEKRLAQNAVDSAALAAAYSFYSGDTNIADATALAENQITTEGFTSSELTLSYYNSSGDTTSTGSDVARVQATIIDSNIPHFGPVLATSVQATANASVGTPGGGYTWGTSCTICTGNGNFYAGGNNLNINISGGNIDVGGSLDIQGNNDVISTANGQILVSGSNISSGSNQSFSPAPLTGQTLPGDPFSAIPYPSVSGTNNGNVTYTGNATISPGIYESITLSSNNTSFTFLPGIYVFTGEGLIVSGQSVTLNGNGLLLYFTCPDYSTTDTGACTAPGETGATFDVTGNNATVNLSASTDPSNTYRNLLIFYDRNNTSPITFTGNNLALGTLYGAVYAINSALSITSNNAGSGVTAVFDTASFNISGNNFNINNLPGVGATSTPGYPPLLTSS